MSDVAGKQHNPAAYAAATCAGLYGAVSLYWACGGTDGLRTLGGYAEHLARSRSGGATVAIWLTVFAKTVGVVIALSLVRPWDRVVTGRWRTVVCGLVSIILMLYGGVSVAGEALVETGALRPAKAVDWTSLHWYLALWDPWFLLWGLLLGAATTRCYHTSPAGRPDQQVMSTAPSPNGSSTLMTYEVSPDARREGVDSASPERDHPPLLDAIPGRAPAPPLGGNSPAVPQQ